MGEIASIAQIVDVHGMKLTKDAQRLAQRPEKSFGEVLKEEQRKLKER